MSVRRSGGSVWLRGAIELQSLFILMDNGLQFQLLSGGIGQIEEH